MKTDFGIPSQQAMAAVAANFFNETILNAKDLLSYLNRVISKYSKKIVTESERSQENGIDKLVKTHESEDDLLNFKLKAVPASLEYLFEDLDIESSSN